MAGRDASIVDSILLVLQKYISHYRGTNLGYASVTTAGILFGISGIATSADIQIALRGTGGLVFALSLVYGYSTGRPFGLDISCTPTHVIKGERQPDKMSESRSNILIQGDSTIIHGEIQLSKFTQKFNIKFEPSSEIGVELQATPRREHKYNPDKNTLTCSDVTEREFPITLEVYPRGDVATSGRYHMLDIRDGDGGRVLDGFDVIDVRN